MVSKNYHDILKNKFAEKVLIKDNIKEIYVDKEVLKDVLKTLKEEGLTFLADVSSADYQDNFEVVYQLFSYDNSDHITVKVKLDHEKPQVDSVTELWDTANWLEREVYDLMGIEFVSHPNLERILTWDGFEGHPLRKDFTVKSKRKSKMGVEV